MRSWRSVWIWSRLTAWISMSITFTSSSVGHATLRWEPRIRTETRSSRRRRVSEDPEVVGEPPGLRVELEAPLLDVGDLTVKAGERRVFVGHWSSGCAWPDGGTIRSYSAVSASRVQSRSSRRGASLRRAFRARGNERRSAVLGPMQARRNSSSWARWCWLRSRLIAGGKTARASRASARAASVADSTRPSTSCSRRPSILAARARNARCAARGRSQYCARWAWIRAHRAEIRRTSAPAIPSSDTRTSYTGDQTTRGGGRQPEGRRGGGS